MNYSIQLLEILITQKFVKRKNKLFQHFIFGKKKEIHFITDSRYIIYDKFEGKIKDKSLMNKDIEFLRRRNETDRIVLEYEIKGNFYPSVKEPFFIVAEFIPPYASCEYCKEPEKKGDFTFCKAKDKVVTGTFKNCTYFKQKRLYAT
ncbi:MAG TPA: hypothetical protein VMZ91_01945 [Candidatus Paceibacterota bacterium]|nr:hypothetical protein [Candidatus Paceibacterota bacterium]